MTKSFYKKALECRDNLLYCNYKLKTKYMANKTYKVEFGDYQMELVHCEVFYR